MAGRASSTRPELYVRHHRTSFPQAHSQCATSCRTIGLDISAEFPKPLTAGEVQAVGIVTAMGCGHACPVYPGKR